jgi:hypothetical protein
MTCILGRSATAILEYLWIESVQTIPDKFGASLCPCGNEVKNVGDSNVEFHSAWSSTIQKAMSGFLGHPRHHDAPFELFTRWLHVIEQTSQRSGCSGAYSCSNSTPSSLPRRGGESGEDRMSWIAQRQLPRNIHVQRLGSEILCFPLHRDNDVGAWEV